MVALGDERGPVVVLDRQGQELWRTEASGGLRRLRAFPLGGPLSGRVLVGSVNGTLSVHQADTGQILWEASLGQAVNEIRPVEVDGNPTTNEVMVGGKDGGVWAYSQDGQQLWADSVSGKVEELAGVSGGGIVVREVLPRKNEFCRTVGGKPKELGVNLDRIFIVSAV